MFIDNDHDKNLDNDLDDDHDADLDDDHDADLDEDQDNDESLDECDPGAPGTAEELLGTFNNLLEDQSESVEDVSGAVGKLLKELTPVNVAVNAAVSSKPVRIKTVAKDTEKKLLLIGKYKIYMSCFLALFFYLIKPFVKGNVH